MQLDRMTPTIPADDLVDVGPAAPQASIPADDLVDVPAPAAPATPAPAAPKAPPIALDATGHGFSDLSALPVAKAPPVAPSGSAWPGYAPGAAPPAPIAQTPALQQAIQDPRSIPTRLWDATKAATPVGGTHGVAGSIAGVSTLGVGIPGTGTGSSPAQGFNALFDKTPPPVESLYSMANPQSEDDMRALAHHLGQRVQYVAPPPGLMDALAPSNPAGETYRDAYGYSLTPEAEAAANIARRGWDNLTPAEKNRFQTLMQTAAVKYQQLQQPLDMSQPVSAGDVPIVGNRHIQNVADAALSTTKTLTGDLGMSPEMSQQYNAQLAQDAKDHPILNAGERFGGAVIDPVARLGARAVGEAVSPVLNEGRAVSLASAIRDRSLSRAVGAAQNSFIHGTAAGAAFAGAGQIARGHIDPDEIVHEAGRQAVQNIAFDAAGAGVKQIPGWENFVRGADNFAQRLGVPRDAVYGRVYQAEYGDGVPRPEYYADRQTDQTMRRELGLDVNGPLTPESISTAYREVAKTTHPDAPGGNAEQFQKATLAYRFLVNKYSPAPKAASGVPPVPQELPAGQSPKQETPHENPQQNVGQPGETRVQPAGGQGGGGARGQEPQEASAGEAGQVTAMTGATPGLNAERPVALNAEAASTPQAAEGATVSAAPSTAQSGQPGGQQPVTKSPITTTQGQTDGAAGAVQGAKAGMPTPPPSHTEEKPHDAQPQPPVPQQRDVPNPPQAGDVQDGATGRDALPAVASPVGGVVREAGAAAGDQSGDVAGVKEPWQMTLPEFIEKHETREMKGWVGSRASQIMREQGLSWEAAVEQAYLLSRGRDNRRLAVEQAIQEGKPVPPEVLADYPDLAPKATPAPTVHTEDSLSALKPKELTDLAVKMGVKKGTRSAMTRGILAGQEASDLSDDQILGGVSLEKNAAGQIRATYTHPEYGAILSVTLKHGQYHLGEKDGRPHVSLSRGFINEIRENIRYAAYRKKAASDKNVPAKQPTATITPEGGDNDRPTNTPANANPGPGRDSDRGSPVLRGEAESPRGAEPATPDEPAQPEPVDAAPARRDEPGDPGESGLGSQEGDADGRGERAGDESVGGGPGRDIDAGTPSGEVAPGEDASEVPQPSPRRAADLPESERNYRVTEPGDLAPVGQVGKIKANIRALELLRTLEAEDRNPTPEEKKTLAQYTGWGHSPQIFDKMKARRWENKGGYDPFADETKNWAEKFYPLHQKVKDLLTPEEFERAAASTINAHYTSRDVIEHGLWGIAQRLGFTGGRVLENSAGIGHVLGLMPEHVASASRITASELDSVTGRMLKKLYPQATVHVMGFQDAKIAPHSQDLVIGNFPFAKDGWRSDKYPFSLHNQFFARSLDLTKPGGLIVAITSDSTLDSPSSAAFRKWMAQRADLVGAIRLPNNAFKKNAGTEVTTDIIVFRKKDGGTFAGAQPFLYTKPMEIGGGKEPVDVNEYFHAHPEMLLGKVSREGTMYRADSPALVPHPGKELLPQLKEAVEKFPANIAGSGAADAIAEPENAGQAAKGAKEYSYQFTKKDNGTPTVYQVQNGELVTPEWAKDRLGKLRLERAQDWAKLRDATRELLDLQRDPEASDASIDAARSGLNKTYDRFVTKHGKVNAPTSRFLSDDPDFPLTGALEIADNEIFKKKMPDGSTVERVREVYRKADIFTKRTLFPRIAPEKADSLEDALSISRSWKNTLDPAYMAQLLGKSEEEVQRDAIAKGVAFDDPDTGQLLAKDEYLSGNVRERLAKAEEAAKDNPAYQKNVDALKAVQPEPLKILDIDFRLGSTWMPPEAVAGWANSLFESPRKTAVHYSPMTGQWSVEWGSGVDYDSKNTDTLAGGGIPATKLIEDALNLKSSIAYDTVRDENGKPKQVRNVERTAAAQDAQQRLKEQFIEWVKKSSFTPQIEDVYNKTFNSFQVRKFQPADFKYYPGATNSIDLRPHQKASVARNMVESNVMAHPVGTGKTYTFITTAMEWRRMGLAKKPMIAVLKATLPQVVESFKRLYPQANILAPDARDFEASSRRKLLNRIATGDYDAVIITHDNLNGLPDDPERERAYIRERIDEMEEALAAARQSQGKKSPTVKDLEKAKAKLESKLSELLDRKKDDTLTFEQLGVDGLIVDEAHKFKRLEFASQMENIKGLDRGYSKRGAGLYMKSRFVQEKTGGRNVVLATGTPVTNTLAEVWNMVRYVRPDLLDAFHVKNFDDFASTFTEPITQLEQTDTGAWKPITRLAKFTNVPELVNLFRSAADVLDPEMLDIPKPALKGGEPLTMTLPRTKAVGDYMQYLIDRYAAWEKLPGKEKREKSSEPLVINGLARKAALDMRLINPSLPDDPGSKINVAAGEVFKRWQEGKSLKTTQVIFADTFQSAGSKDVVVTDTGGNVMRDAHFNAVTAKEAIPDSQRFNVYNAIRDKLVSLGVPRNEIAIIHEHDTDKKREVLFDKVNNGDVRVVMGSTEKLGIGVNIQKKLATLHHLDAPWRPADVEQREGRILRQGNENPEVEIVRYGVDRSFDASAYQRLATKQRFINEVMSGKAKGRTMDDAGAEAVASFQEAFADISGNPLAKEKFDLENRIKQMERLQRQHDESQYDSRNKLESRRRDLPGSQANAAAIRKQAEELPARFADEDAVAVQTPLGKATGKEGAAKALDAYMKQGMEQIVARGRAHASATPHRLDLQPVNVNGLEVHMTAQVGRDDTGFAKGDPDIHYQFKVSGSMEWAGGNATTGAGFLRSLRGRIDGLPNMANQADARVANIQRSIKELSGLQGKPFPREAELAEAKARHAAVLTQLEEASKAEAAKREADQKADIDSETPPPGDAIGQRGMSEGPPGAVQIGTIGGASAPFLRSLMGDIRGLRERFAPIESRYGSDIAKAFIKTVSAPATEANTLATSFLRRAFGDAPDPAEAARDWITLGWYYRRKDLRDRAAAKGLNPDDFGQSLPDLPPAEVARLEADPIIQRANNLYNKEIAPLLTDIRTRNGMLMNPNAAKMPVFLNLPTESDGPANTDNSVNPSKAFNKAAVGNKQLRMDPKESLAASISGHLATDYKQDLVQIIKSRYSIPEVDVVPDPTGRGFQAKFRGRVEPVEAIDTAVAGAPAPSLHYVPKRIADQWNNIKQERGQFDTLFDKAIQAGTKLATIGDLTPHAARVIAHVAARQAQSGQSVTGMLPSWLGSNEAAMHRMTQMMKSPMGEAMQLLIDRSGSDKGSGFDVKEGTNRLSRMLAIPHNVLFNPDTGLDPMARRVVADSFLRILKGNDYMDELENELASGVTTPAEAAGQLEKSLSDAQFVALGRRVNGTLGFANKQTRSKLLNDLSRIFPFLSSESGMIPREVGKVVNFDKESLKALVKHGVNGRWWQAGKMLAGALATGAIGLYLALNALNFTNTKIQTGKGRFLWDNDEGHRLDLWLAPGWHLTNLDPTFSRAMRLTGTKGLLNDEGMLKSAGMEALNEPLSMLANTIRWAVWGATTAAGRPSEMHLIQNATGTPELMKSQPGGAIPLVKNAAKALAGGKPAGPGAIQDAASVLTGANLSYDDGSNPIRQAVRPLDDKIDAFLKANGHERAAIAAEPTDKSRERSTVFGAAAKGDTAGLKAAVDKVGDPEGLLKSLWAKEPLSEIPESLRGDFLKTLSPADNEQLAKGQAAYAKVRDAILTELPPEFRLKDQEHALRAQEAMRPLSRDEMRKLKTLTAMARNVGEIRKAITDGRLSKARGEAIIQGQIQQFQR